MPITKQSYEEPECVSYKGLSEEFARLRDLRGILFEKVEINVNDKLETRTRLDHYLRQLADRSARGDVHANRDIEDFLELERRNMSRLPSTPETRRLRAATSRFQARMASYERNTERFSELYFEVHEKIRPEVIRHLKGPDANLAAEEDPLPHYIKDDEPLRNIRRRNASIKRAKAKDQPFEVGYGKPPTHSRFDERNSGRSRQRGTESPFTNLHKALAQPAVLKKANGTTVTIKRSKLAQIRIFNNAINGDRSARRELKRGISALFNNKMLSAAKPPDRRTPEEKYGKLISRLFQSAMAAQIKSDLVALHKKDGKELPDFTTDYEHSLMSREEVKEACTKLLDALNKRRLAMREPRR